MLNQLFLPPTNIFIRFFCTLSNGDSTITFMAKAYIMAIKVSPQNLHACDKNIQKHFIKILKKFNRYCYIFLYSPLMSNFDTLVSSSKRLFAVE